VLVLADADAFGIDFDELGERILQRRAMLDRARTVRSRSGNSSRATSLAE